MNSAIGSLDGAPEGALKSRNRPVDIAMWHFGPHKNNSSSFKFQCKSCGENKTCVSYRAIAHVLGKKGGWKACKSPDPSIVSALENALNLKSELLKSRKRERGNFDDESTESPTENNCGEGLGIYKLPCDLRLACRSGGFQGQTSGQAPGYAQANLCILPKTYAFDFLLFCQRNPKPCPILHVLEPGKFALNDIDVRRDFPKYRIFRNGEMEQEVANIADIWQSDFVSFIIGCSFSFEEALANAGLKIRHLEEGKNVPMYNTNIPCESAGKFHSNLVVSMRPFTPADAIASVSITARYPKVHGAPVHIGDPAAIGIHNIGAPDYGDAVTICPGEVPVFWACGVTPQAAVMRSK